MDYYCKVCDRSVKIKSKKKHLNSQTHKNIDDREVIRRYRIENPDFFQVENILKKYILE